MRHKLARNIELRHLRYFVAVAEERSFLRASERLHISQPPLSTQIRELEERLGARLLERSSRGVSMTPAGSVLYRESISILSRLEHAQVEVNRVSQGQQGNFDLGFLSMADHNVLPSTLCSFKSKCPDISVQLHQLDSFSQIRELEAENIDAAFTIWPIESSRISFAPLYEEGMVLAVPEGHKTLKHGGRPSMQTYSNELFVMPPRELAPALFDATIQFCEKSGFTPNITQYANELQTVVSLVSSGLGIALVPSSAQSVQRTGVAYIKPLELSPMLSFGLCHRTDDPNPLLQSFLECARGINLTARSTSLLN